MSGGAEDSAALERTNPARAKALDDALEATTARARAANDALEAAANHPDIRRAAGVLLALAETFGPAVAGMVGGPGAAAIATLAVQIESRARAAASGG